MRAETTVPRARQHHSRPQVGRAGIRVTALGEGLGCWHMDLDEAVRMVEGKRKCRGARSVQRLPCTARNPRKNTQRSTAHRSRWQATPASSQHPTSAIVCAFALPALEGDHQLRPSLGGAAYVGSLQAGGGGVCVIRARRPPPPARRVACILCMHAPSACHTNDDRNLAASCVATLPASSPHAIDDCAMQSCALHRDPTHYANRTSCRPLAAATTSTPARF